jgi:signal transduction histidine kinase
MWKRTGKKVGEGISSLRLTTLIILFPLVSLLLYGGLSHLFFFYAQKQETRRELAKYEQTLMEIEKNRLKEKVENLAQFVHYYDSKSSDKIKKDATSIVNIVVNVANNICRSYKGKMDEQALKALIINALSNIKFEGDLGYLFLIDMKGNLYVHIDPKLAGTNIMDIRDVNGKYIVREFTRVIREKGEGFVDYYWYIVSEDRKQMHYKISYVKKLACFDWYVGAGEYLKYMKRYVRKDLLSYIRDNHRFEGGYFFVSDSNNRVVYAPQEEELYEKDIKKYRQEGFFQDEVKIAYTKYIAEYDWYITAVKALGEIRKDIAHKKHQSEMKRSENVKMNFYLMLFSWVISLMLSIYLSLVMNRMLKRYERQLRETNEKLVFQSRQALLGELLPMIAHQWRQPINKIASILALLRFGKEEKRSAEVLDGYYREMEDNIEFMSETIDDFRTFYQPKECTTEENIDELIHRSLEFVEGSIRKKDITVHTSLEKITHLLYANEFLQVMINLIKNAVDALPSQGELWIRLYRKEGMIVIEVEDNGKGIDKEKIDKVFDPYFTTKEDSMGLGLYMSKIIIEKHMYGSISVENLPRGGVRFSIYFRDGEE